MPQHCSKQTTQYAQLNFKFLSSMRYQMDTPSTMSLCILPTLSNSQISQNVRHVECEIHVITWIKISSC